MKKSLAFNWRLLAVPLLVFLALPILTLLLRTSPERVAASLQQEQVVQAISISFKTTLISLVFTILFGTPVAYLMGRRKFRFKSILDALIDLPTLLPPSVAGLVLLLAFGRRGPLGSLLEMAGLQVVFTPAAVVLVQVFIAAPFFIRASALGFANVDLEVIQAAQLDGASRWQSFQYVILPLSRRALVSGAMMSWARALGEFGATMIFAGNFPGRTQTMTTAIYLGFEKNLESALTLSVILVIVSFLSLLFIKILIAFESERVI